MLQINSTEVAGLLAYIPATLAAGAAWRVTARSRTGARAGWAMIALIHALLSIDIFTNSRQILKASVDDWMMAEGTYSGRRPTQIALLAGVTFLALVLAACFLRRAPTAQLLLARWATAAALTLVAIEMVSLHQVDAVMYRSVGPIMLLGWLWLVCGWTTTIAALRATR